MAVEAILMARKTAQDLQRIDQARGWYIAKSNELIQHSRYSLPITQQKMLLYLISKIKPQDSGEELYTFNITDFCDAVGLDRSEGYYHNLKAQLKALADSSVWIRMEDNKEHLFRWIEDPVIDPGSGTVEIQFKKIVRPYLFDLKARYTQYKFIEVARLKSKYAIRLFELLRSYTTQEKLSNGQEVDQPFTVDELKLRMDATETYKRYFDFKKRVLIPAVDEINACSDTMHIDFEEHRRGNAIKAIIFTIGAPKALETLNARSETRKRLDHMSY